MIYRFWIILFCLTLCCSSRMGWAAERFPFLGEVSSDKVSIRAGYHTNFERLDIVSRGTQLLVLAKEYDWYKVQLPPSAKAYVRVDYIKPVNAKVGQINAERLNIRAGRGVNFSPIGQLNKGVYVRLVSKFDDWFQIEPVEGLYGWVSQDFIKVKSYTVPPLDQLGLLPISADDNQSLKVQSDVSLPGASSGSSVVVTGLIEPVSSETSLKNIQYQFIADDKSAYYLKVDPAVVKGFVHKAVRLEGEAVAGVSSSLDHSILLVKKFSLVL
jgi:hypothetical protein